MFRLFAFVVTIRLVAGTDGICSRSNPSEYILVTKDSEYERALMQFIEQEKRMQGRLLGYMQALSEIQFARIVRSGTTSSHCSGAGSGGTNADVVGNGTITGSIWSTSSSFN